MVKPSATTTAAQTKLVNLMPIENTFRFFPFKKSITPFIVIILLGLIFNLTSLHNEYALDDGIIIHQNDHVIKGLSGIKGILTKDAYESFYRRMNASDQLAGGRYRPLSVVTFAIEQEIIGAYPENGLYPGGCWDQNKDGVNQPEEDVNNDGVFNEVDCQVKGAHFRHFINIITYIIGILVFFLFMRNYIFRSNHDLAFLAAILFLMHPIHTEAVANVKSRDELVSLIFISLTFFYSFRYIDYQRYLKEESFISKLADSTRQIIFLLIAALVAFLAFYIVVINKFALGVYIGVPTLGILGLLLYTAFITFYKQHKLSKTLVLAWAAVNMLLALLSKEYAVVLIALIPVALYVFHYVDFDYKTFVKSPDFILFLKIFGSFMLCAFLMLYLKRDYDIHFRPGQKAMTSFWLFPFIYLFLGIFAFADKKKRSFSILMSWHFFIVLFCLGMRLVAVKLKPGVPDTELLNNPYLLANGEERFMTKALVLLKYFCLCWFPHPLTSDYSFNTIIYRHFTSWDSILSIVLHLTLAYMGFKLVLKKHILGFAIATYFGFLLMVGNILMDIGATMGERLLFHSTIGFVIGFAWLILKGFDNLPKLTFAAKRAVFLIFIFILSFLYCIKCWERNWDWKNDISLFLKDVEIIPNSVLVLGNAGARYIDLSSTTTYMDNPYDSTLVQLKELKKNPRIIDYGLIEKAGFALKSHIGSIEVYHVDSANQELFNKKRVAFLEKGIKYLKHAVSLHPRYVNGYLNLGLGSFQLGKDRDAIYFWKMAENLYPNNPYLTSYYNVFTNETTQRGIRLANAGQIDQALFELNKAVALKRDNAEIYYNMGAISFRAQRYGFAKYYWDECLKYNPNHPNAKEAIKSIIPVANVKPIKG